MGPHMGPHNGPIMDPLWGHTHDPRPHGSQDPRDLMIPDVLISALILTYPVDYVTWIRRS